MDESNSSAVVVFTTQHRIRGRIALLPGARLTDFVQHAGDFMAITGVEVCTHEGRPLFTTPFLDLATTAIEIILPAEQFHPVGES
jgi:hypothetical protein